MQKSDGGRILAGCGSGARAGWVIWRLQSISAETNDGKIQNPKTKSVTWLGNEFTDECREQITILILIFQILLLRSSKCAFHALNKNTGPMWRTIDSPGSQYVMVRLRPVYVPLPILYMCSNYVFFFFFGNWWGRYVNSWPNTKSLSQFGLSRPHSYVKPSE